MNRRRWTILAAAVAVLLAVVFFLRRETTEAEQGEEHHDTDVVEIAPEGQRNIKLQIAEVSQEQIVRTVRATGVVTPDEGRQAHVFPLARGVVEQVFVRLGNTVKKGQSLLVYDNIELGELIGQHQSAHSEVERERAQRDVTTRSLDRATVLIEKEAISQREFEVRRAEKEQADAAVNSKLAELAQIEEKLHRFGLTEKDVQALRNEGEHRTASHSILRAPLSGIITKFDVAPGELVTPDKGLFTIVDTSIVWVLADIYEKDIGLVAQKGECIVSLPSYPEESFKGTIAYVSDFLDPTTRTAKLRCVVGNANGKLKLEMFGDVLIPTRRTTTVLSIPGQAVQEVNGETSLFVQTSPTQFERRTVKLGQRDAHRVEVLEGVREGEKVVTNGSFQLKTEAMRESIGDEH